MKKIFFCLGLITGFAPAGYSQNVRLNAYGSYVFDDKVDDYYSSTSFYNGKIKGGFLWGAGLEYRVHDYYGIELLYQRLDTKAPIEYYDPNAIGNNIKEADLDVAINYIMLGGARALRASDKAEPYGGFMLGMAIVDTKNPDNGNSSSSTKFAWGLRLGANIWASEKVGIKLQTQLLSIPQGAGGSVYFGTGGAGVGVSTYSSVLQFVLGGGLAFKLGGQKTHTTTQPQTPQ
jgi:opacity protein-like surface antigen